MDKEKILGNIHYLSAEQLHNYIKTGIVTLQELMANELDYKVRKDIIQLQENEKVADNEAYKSAQNEGTEYAYQKYLENYPNGVHVGEANAVLNALKRSRENAQNQKAGILNNIKNDHNSYTPGEIRDFISNQFLTWEDISNCGIPDDIIDALIDYHETTLDLGETPERIPNGFTEVYFWGIPGSGKTCALASILSVANKKGLLQQELGTGYDYMTRLINIFNDDFGFLPAPSPVDVTQYLPFLLRRESGDKKLRSVSLIELSGEIFRCFYYANAKKPMPSEFHESTFRNLKNYLMSPNRKVHFFFIDYSIKNKLDSNNYTQGDYLNAAALYFREHSIFKDTTDAIYIVTTKSDLMPCDSSQRKKHAVTHLNEKFSSFVNTLKDICVKHSINGGKLTVEPFSLGEVYFNSICSLNESSPSQIVDILLERIIPRGKGGIGSFFNK